ncbi:unnamed protein product [Lasius platythorax]|uniref:type I protein arginine methyltransferase n=1 Tax=Lasius platythorax TaxID=488582 RepID=A0AAV2N841_9HYME
MDEYFGIYEKFDILRLMLKDKTRVLMAYKNAIFNMKEKFQGKVVMDVGAGSGILSIFCAEVGAKKVYAIEASMLAKTLEQVLIENNLQSTIEVIHCEVADIHPDSLEKIDIIVSEWMGFYLVHEGKLDSVLFARDKFLRKGGLIFPSIAKLYASLCQLSSMYEFRNACVPLPVYLNTRCIGKEYRKIKSMEPEVLLLNRDSLLSSEELKIRDIRTVENSEIFEKLLVFLDLNIISKSVNLLGEEYVLTCKSGKYQGICIWFVIEFPDGSKLSTAPYNEPTHWKQTVVVLPTVIEVKNLECIAFKLNLKRDALNRRRYTIELNLLDTKEIQQRNLRTYLIERTIYNRDTYSVMINRYPTFPHVGCITAYSLPQETIRNRYMRFLNFSSYT